MNRGTPMTNSNARKRAEARDHQEHWDAEVRALIARTRAETLEECAQQARKAVGVWSTLGLERIAATFDAAAQAIREGES